ncbi:hypothetical protein WJX73_010510 [Symbiochloris irregularis]|uniref:Uncharacterized protein n=1 Tax=Symbiochloris irregularis TaxID=706552 RepID=A0AAW1P1B3_9CHLO
MALFRRSVAASELLPSLARWSSSSARATSHTSTTSAGEELQAAAEQPGVTMTSMSSFSDPTYDFMQQPYERPPRQRAPALLKYGLVPRNHTSFNHNSYMDPVYDFMQENYERPRGLKKRGN